MLSHNERIAPISSITLNPEDTIGVSINWYLSHKPVQCDIMNDMFMDAGLPTNMLPKPTSGHARFRELCAYQNPRIYYKNSTYRREFVCSQVKHTGEDRDLLSYAYSANLGGGREKARLVQIGTLTYDKKVDRYSWRFAHDRSHSSVDANLDSYIDRCLLAGMSDDFTREELVFFSTFCDTILSEVDLYASTPHYDVVRMRDILGEMLLHVGCYSLSQRGGFWFAPRVGDDGGPYTMAMKLIEVYEALDEANKFMLLTMPKDANTIQTASSSIEYALLWRVGEVEKAMEEVTVQTRAGQHDSRLRYLDGILDKAVLYRDLLGMATDQIEHKITDIRSKIAEQTLAFRASIEAKLAGAADNDDLQESSSAVSLEGIRSQTAAFYKKAISASSDAPSSVHVDGLLLTIEQDSTLGYTYTIISTTDSSYLRTGTASTQKALVELLRSIED